jgi:paraquat-inducible protein A
VESPTSAPVRYGISSQSDLSNGMIAAQAPDSDQITDLDGLVACPTCDVLHRIPQIAPGQKARCLRCHRVLLNPRESAMTSIVMLAVTATVLMFAAISFPFLMLHTHGLSKESSVIDAILAFSSGLMIPLSFAVAALIVVLPLMRLMAIIYVLAPMAIGWGPAKGAMQAFRMAEALKPWAMAEVFMVGVAVVLVKVTDLARLSIGPAFWAFAGLVIVMVLKDNFMCRLTIWQTLEARSRH